MSDIDTARAVATSRVMRTIARIAGRNPLPVRAEHGTHPIVVALPTDTVDEVRKRHERIGGHANLFVAYDDKLVLLSVHDLVPLGEGQVAAGGSSIPVAPDADIDMLVTWLKSTATQSGHIRLTPAKHAAPSAPVLQEFEYAF